MTTSLMGLGARLSDFELGQLDQDASLDLFADLVRSGLAWQLQGSYGRMAVALIDEGLLSQFGDRLDNGDVLDGEVMPETD